MSLTTSHYLKAIRDSLDAVLNLRYFPSPLVERQIHPEVEFQDNTKLLLNPIVISKSELEHCLIESSINSVRVSIAIRKGSETELLLTHMLERFMAMRADKFEILRKKVAVEGYDFSFLFTDEHLNKFKKEELINFILEFIQGIDKEIKEMVQSITNHTRLACQFFTNALANNKIE
jgi:actin related protein 2/3 complex subunit 4